MTPDFSVGHSVSSLSRHLWGISVLSAEQLVLAEAEERGRVVFFMTVPSSSELQNEVSARTKCLSVLSGVCHLGCVWGVVPSDPYPASRSSSSTDFSCVCKLYSTISSTTLRADWSISSVTSERQRRARACCRASS